MNNRWQDKRFKVLDWYKYAQTQRINGAKIPQRAKGICHAILDKFGMKASFPINLDKLAGDCGVDPKTLRKYRPVIEGAKLFFFDVPPYWARKIDAKEKQATTIRFPTRQVTKWLHNRGLLTAKPDWVCHEMTKTHAPSENPYEMATSEKTPGNGTFGSPDFSTAAIGSQPTKGKSHRSLPKEVAAPSAADGLGFAAAGADRPSPPRLATKEDGQLGANYYGDWIAATETPLFERQGKWLGASVDNGEGGIGSVIGFPVSSAPESLDGHVLVQFTEVDGEPWDEPACWVPLTDLELVQPEPKPVAHNIKLGARVRANRPGVFFGGGTVVGFDKNGEPIVTPDCAPRVKTPCNPRHLEVIDEPNKMFDVAANVVHRNLAAGE